MSMDRTDRAVWIAVIALATAWATVASAQTEPPFVVPAEKDTFLRRGNPNRNEGANPRLRIRNTGNNRALASFDLSAFFGVSQATLVLNIAENSNNWGLKNDRTVDAHPLLTDFAEGNGQNAGVPFSARTRGVGSGATWNCATDAAIENIRADCETRWDGGDFGPATAAPVLHVNGQLGEVRWDVTADVQSGTTAWLIKKTNEGRNGNVRYYSREGSLAAFGDLRVAPRLEVVAVSNGLPVAVDDAYDSLIDTLLDVDADSGLLVNDFNPPDNTNPLEVHSFQTPTTAGGSVDVFTDGSFRYTPPNAFVGIDTFVYDVRDEDGQISENPATVTITVLSESSIVTAFDDEYDTTANTTLLISAAEGLLVNDVNADDPPPNPPLNDDLTVISVDDSGLQGQVLVDADGSFDYTPPSNVLSIVETFTYVTANSANELDSATVTITVFSASVPVAVDDSYSVGDLGDPVVIDAASGLLVNDQGVVPLTVSAFDAVTAAGRSVSVNADGGVTYTPSGLLGIDTFTYEIQDAQEATSANRATVTITVLAPPDAVDDSYDLLGSTSLAVPVANGLLQNDTDAEGEALSVAGFSTFSAQGGLVSANVDGSFVYTAPASDPPAIILNPTDTFAYFVRDEGGLTSESATVTIVGLNNEPTADDVAVATTEELALTENFAGDDVDADDDPSSLAYSILTQPQAGTAALGATNGTFTFDPGTGFQDLAAGEQRTVRFDYQVTDSHGAVSSIATVSITVTGVDAAPVADDVEFAVVEIASVASATVAAAQVGNVITACFDADDADSDDDPSTLNYVILTQPIGGGTATLGAIQGTFDYDPLGFAGLDEFTYQVTGANDGVSNIATVRINVGLPAGTGVWYVDNAAPAGGNGSQTAPFNSLAPLNGAGGVGDVDGPGEVIILINSGLAYIGGLEMEDSQELIGQGNPTLSNPLGDGIVLARCNIVQGVSIIGTAGAGISGDSVGIATLDNVTVNGPGNDGIRLRNAAHAITITNSTISNHPNGDGIQILNDRNSMSDIVRIGVDANGVAAGNTFGEIAGSHPHQAIHIIAAGADHHMIALVRNNVITAQGDFLIGAGNGVFVQALEEAELVAEITDNNITDRAGDNIAVEASTGATISVLIENNTLTGTGFGSGARESAIQIATIGESEPPARVANVTIVNGVLELEITNQITGFTGTGVFEPIKIIVPTSFCSGLDNCNSGICVGNGVCDCGVVLGPCISGSCNDDCSACVGVSACPPSLGTCDANPDGFCDPVTGECGVTAAGVPCVIATNSTLCVENCDGVCDGAGACI